jgi:Flp pilus assembly protein TadG
MNVATRVERMGGRARPRGVRQGGSTLVEQAIILPVLLALFFGAIDMGRALYSYSYVSYIAREATRWASVRSVPPAGPITPTEVTNFVKGSMGGALDPARVTVDTNWIPPANGSPRCTGTGGAQKPGCVVQVTVNYSFKFVLPFLPGGTVIPMSSESQMIITQ